ncbi:hypothetical protein OU798_19995 [Prolixibacteraceae bacterium Z1-6]|uniref:Altered inheritance of mitochondria protein 6 n=1 Tax=Draconibacterium aestuarii TaxID=2998507 RepID=A0A9X3F8U3_9BACT|nr:hypothetical protein [Prolixibacteraceae bacterium Z1-6]
MNFKNLFYITVLFFVAQSCSVNGEKSESRIYKHSHNDYEHEHPLFDALNQNFRSIEADVYSIDDSLFVAHDFNKIKPGRTLRRLYLEPLKNQIEINGGSVYGDDEEIILFIDIKDNGLETYKLLCEILQEYKKDLSVIEEGVKTIGAIQVVVSGNRPLEYMKQQTTRLAGIDGRLKDLESDMSPQLMPVLSDNWTNYFSWNGIGEMPELEKELLHSLVEKAHLKGYYIRFWATPNQTPEQQQAVWTELINAKVDLIGTDNLQELNQFLMKLEKN